MEVDIYTAFKSRENFKKDSIDIGVDFSNMRRIYKQYIIGF